MGDVWDDIAPDLRDTRHRYEGRKPDALLEKIVQSASPEGALICDPFAGSGATAVAALKTGRHFLTCDNGFFGVHLAKSNILQYDKPFKVVKHTTATHCFRQKTRLLTFGLLVG